MNNALDVVREVAQRADGRTKGAAASADVGPISLLLPDLELGGGQRNLIALAAELRALGRDVELIVCNGSGPLRAAVPEDVPVVDLGRDRVRSALPPLVRHLRRRRPDCLLSSIEHASVLAVVAGSVAGTGAKVVVRVATSLRRLAGEDLGGRVVASLARLLYPRAAALVVNSPGAADDLAAFLRIDRRRIAVLHNLAVSRQLAAAGSPEDVPHPWLAPGEPPVVLAVGRLARVKNHRLLVDAFAVVRRTLPSRLIILGDGPERAALEAQVRRLSLEDDVDLPGFAADPAPFMRRSRVFVQSSDAEGSPNALIEALACGATVVATDCRNGPRDVLASGRYGRLTRVGDRDDLVAALRAALVEPRPAPREAWAPYEHRTAARAYDRMVCEVVHGARAA